MRVVSVHRNLNKGRKEGVKYYSVKDRKTQRVNGDIRPIVALINVRFTVGEAARQRVLAGGNKEVYAWATGLDDYLLAGDTTLGTHEPIYFERLHFTPEEGFYVRREGKIVHVAGADRIVMNQHGSFVTGAKER